MEENKVLKNEKGQLSIFLGISLLVVITMLAFVINVGLFVKAKINLQNAVDSAAYAGASVQARQLTNIAYLNWEMRNTYKEWMFKYYVLGNLGLKSTKSPAGDNMNFRMVSFFGTGEAENTGKNFDPYNAPSTCIHFGSEHNICEIYDVPGLPRFQTVGLPSISPHHEAFLNNIAKIKANNCSVRSDINMGVSMIWAYGTGSNLFQDMPQIAATRVGAWPQAIELGMRIRNLEMMVNRPALSNSPICISGEGCTPLEILSAEASDIPLNERPIKAFYSAYRNLSGGSVKFSSDGNTQDSFSGSFRLYEIPPEPIDATGTLGEMLIPLDATIGNSGVQATQKQYLDLWAWPLNLTTFYTIFTSDSEEGFANAGVTAEAGCKGTKTALPVPGYLFGFSKNPNSLTYYAVKGEAKYIGLMFPFSETEGITLQAYAAAKPFGGRIGPMLFASNGKKGVSVRSDSIVGKSVPYVSVFEPAAGGASYVAGFPIPYDDTFFAKSADMIGGLPGANSESKFVIPNMIYDETQLIPKQVGTGTAAIQVLRKASGQAQAYNTNQPEKYGLYDVGQFKNFRSNLVQNQATVFSEEEINESIRKVRAPTIYEAMNYLVPISYQGNGGQLNSIDSVHIDSPNNDGSFNYSIYAPLFGNGTLYGSNSASIEAIISKHIEDVKPAINQYITALGNVAESIMTRSAGTRGGKDTYFQAANRIHDVDPNSGKAALKQVDAANCDVLSLASKFNFFFFGNADGITCGMLPLKTLIRNYLNTTDAGFAQFYRSSYKAPSKMSNRQLATGFFPGERQGVNAEGMWTNPFGGDPSGIMKRNYYSTKFVPIQKLTDQQDSFWNTSIPIIQEIGGLSEDTPDTATNKGDPNNKLNAQLLDDFKSNLPH